MTTINPEEVAKFSAIADEWWDPQGKFKPLHQLGPVRLRFLRDALCEHFSRDATQAQPLAGLRLLDIGCGGGLICEPLTRLGAEMVGVDASEKNISVAKVHAAAGGLNIDYRAGNAEDLAAAGEQFDAVLALEIVEHVADVNLFIASVSKLIKPSGIGFFSTINRTPKSYLMAIVGAEYVLRWLPRGTHDWKKFLKPSEMNTHFAQHGLQLFLQRGMVLDPIRWEWNLSETDLDVNYLQATKKAA